MDRYEGYEHLLVDVDELGVATVTFNRPEKMNAFNWVMERDFSRLLWDLDADDDVKVIVVTGAGRAFSSGIDLSGGAQDAFSADAKEAHEATTGGGSDSLADKYGLWRMATPIIGAINGHAIGAGLTLAFLFDIRIVAEDAKLQLVFTRRAILPDANASWLLQRMVGLTRALDLLITGRRFDGREAVEYGIATRAVPAEEVLPAAQALAREIAVHCSPAAVGLVKRLVYQMAAETDRGAAFQRETDMVWWIGQQPDVIAGVMAWMADKDPQWKMPKYPELPEELRFPDSR
jgi:enoyl-CoA hydratase/carnithine racemase